MQLRSDVHLGLHLRKLILSDGEDHADRIQLCDHHEAGGIAGVNNVSRVHQAQPHAPVDGRNDMRVDQVQFRAVDSSLIGFDGALILKHQRLLGGVLLFWNGLLIQQHFVAVQIDVRVLK